MPTTAPRHPLSALISAVFYLLAVFALTSLHGCAHSDAASRLRDTLPIVAASTRELCLSAGDAVIAAERTGALDAQEAMSNLARIHGACEALGSGLVLLDNAVQALNQETHP